MALYLEAKQRQGRGSARDQYSLKRLKPFFAGKAVPDIRRRDVRSYVEVRHAEGVQFSTIRRELKLPCASINYATLELEVPLPNPFKAMGLLESEPRVRWLTRAEASTLEAAATGRWPHLACFIALALHTGCRKSELMRLEWRRVDLERGLLSLEAKHTKSRRRRSVPLNEAARSALRRLGEWVDAHCAGSPWVFARSNGQRLTTLQKGFKAACARAGIEDFRVHDLRHTCASWLVMAGVSLSVVRDLLGHSSISVTERYAHLAPEQVRSAVQLLLPL